MMTPFTHQVSNLIDVDVNLSFCVLSSSTKIKTERQIPGITDSIDLDVIWEPLTHAT